MFEAVEFIEAPGQPEPTEKVLGEYAEEIEAVTAARNARMEFANTASKAYAWWVVRQQGAQLAHFIADSKSDKEFVLDLTSGQLVEV
ncbi:MAG TPA: hypothetical protein VI980_13035 [Acidimicrobiia bacterium]|nr:hypothetical protein [Acidimicrobiia bacterium]